MAQTKEGAAKVRARRAGVTVAELREKERTQKWCIGCGAWHPRASFAKDRTRFDGLASYCPTTHRRGERKPQPALQVRAHRLIQMRVQRGMIPNPNTLPCTDCGHLGDDRRHEYDHHRGYSSHEARASVQPVCKACHTDREMARKAVEVR